MKARVKEEKRNIYCKEVVDGWRNVILMIHNHPIHGHPMICIEGYFGRRHHVWVDDFEFQEEG